MATMLEAEGITGVESRCALRAWLISTFHSIGQPPEHPGVSHRECERKDDLAAVYPPAGTAGGVEGGRNTRHR